MIERQESLERVHRKMRVLDKLTQNIQEGERVIVGEPKGRYFIALYTGKQADVLSGRPVMIRKEPGNRLGVY